MAGMINLFLEKQFLFSETDQCGWELICKTYHRQKGKLLKAFPVYSNIKSLG